MAYIIKNNLPKDGYKTVRREGEEKAKESFMDMQAELAKKYSVKAVFRNKPLRGRIQVEVDGFYYYVELYKEK